MTAMPYTQALATFRQEVNRKFPPSIRSRRVTRHTQQIQGRYCGRGRGSRGRGPRGRERNSNRGMKRKLNARHPNSYPVTFTDGTVMNIHAIYLVGPEVWNKLPPNEIKRIINDRNEYKRQNFGRTLPSSTIVPQLIYNNSQALVT